LISFRRIARVYSIQEPPRNHRRGISNDRGARRSVERSWSSHQKTGPVRISSANASLICGRHQPQGAATSGSNRSAAVMIEHPQIDGRRSAARCQSSVPIARGNHRDWRLVQVTTPLGVSEHLSDARWGGGSSSSFCSVSIVRRSKLIAPIVLQTGRNTAN
jgi:hypothetical protein